MNPQPSADYDAGRTPHTHGGTDAPECTQYGAHCRPEEAAGQCDHWNDRLPDGTVLRAIRCRRDAGHDGLHLCGDTSWSEDLGTRVTPPGGGREQVARDA